MIEFVRPAPKPVWRAMPGADPLEAGDIRPAAITGFQWLVNAPVVEVTVIDERGQPAPMRCPDPRFWAIHKLWLSGRVDREAQKRLRDRQQAEIMLRLIADKLPQFTLDSDFRRLLPGELAAELGSVNVRGTTTSPSW